MSFYVIVESDEYDTAAIGPYPDKEAAELARDHSECVTSFLEESATDCFIKEFDYEPSHEDYDVTVIDSADIYYLGEKPKPEKIKGGSRG